MDEFVRVKDFLNYAATHLEITQQLVELSAAVFAASSADPKAAALLHAELLAAQQSPEAQAMRDHIARIRCGKQSLEALLKDFAGPLQ